MKTISPAMLCQKCENDLSDDCCVKVGEVENDDLKAYIDGIDQLGAFLLKGPNLTLTGTILGRAGKLCVEKK